MRLHYVLLALCALSLFSYCNHGNKVTDGTENKTRVIANSDSLAKSNEQRFLKRIYGKEIASIDNIIPEYDSNALNIVFIIGQFDCVSCVEAGYGIIRQISEIKGDKNTYVVGIDKKVHIPRYYKDMVYEDKRRTLHDELSYIPTPILLVLQGKCVVDLHCPNDAKATRSMEFIHLYSY